MTISAHWDDDLAAMASDLPSTIVWRGQTVTCTASPVTRTDDVAAEGVYNVREVEAVVRLASFSGGAYPQVRDSLTLDGAAYYVLEREVDAAGVRLMLRQI